MVWKIIAGFNFFVAMMLSPVFLYGSSRVQIHTPEAKPSLSLINKDPKWLTDLSGRVTSYADLKWHISLINDHQEEVRFSIDEIPVCDSMLRVTHSSGQLVVLGEWPSASSVSGHEWPALSSLLQTDKNNLKVIKNPKKCWFQKEMQWKPAWEVHAFDQGYPKVFWFSEDGEIKQRNLFFSVSGKVRSFLNGLGNEETRDVSVDLSGNTFLETEHFLTETGPALKSESAEHSFLYEADDPRMAETTSFVGVYETYEWLKKLGYSWHKPKSKLKIVLHKDVVVGEVAYKNQAVYYATDPQGSSDVVIQIADGDGIALKDLPYEDDVASHEFGHHVVYQYVLSSTQSEKQGQTEKLEHSGAIHEAFADYFYAARKGDPCFGASLCLEEGESACYVRGQCMRTLKNSIAYDSDLYWSLPGHHLKSQMISGWFWDIRNFEGVVATEWDQVVYSAVEFLSEKVVYSDVLIALAAADLMHYDGKHLCVIADTANGRGFQSAVAQEIPDCKNYRSARLQSKKDLESVTDGDGKVKTAYCGVVGHDIKSINMYWWMFLFPLIYLWAQQFLFSGLILLRNRKKSYDFLFYSSRSRNNRNDISSR